MLVLQRKMEQSIVVDGRIEIQILRISGGRVTLGISAPSDVRIDREERRSGFDPLEPVDPHETFAQPVESPMEFSHVPLRIGTM